MCVYVDVMSVYYFSLVNWVCLHCTIILILKVVFLFSGYYCICVPVYQRGTREYRTDKSMMFYILDPKPRGWNLHRRYTRFHAIYQILGLGYSYAALWHTRRYHLVWSLGMQCSRMSLMEPIWNSSPKGIESLSQTTIF